LLPAALCLARYTSRNWVEWHVARKFSIVRHSSRKSTRKDSSATDGANINCREINYSAICGHADAQRALGKHVAFLSSHHRVHAGSVFGSGHPDLAGYIHKGVAGYIHEGVRASQRMLVSELISAHANITPKRTMPSAQFIRDHKVQALLWTFAG